MRQDGSGGNSAYQDNLFSQDRVKSYLKIINTPYVLDPVRQTLHLGMTVQDLSRKVSANVPLDTVVVDVSAEDESPDGAKNIANAVVEEFSKAVPRLEADNGGTSPVAVTVVRHAETPTSPSSPQFRPNLALGLIAGLVLGLGIAMLRDRLDTAIKGPGDVMASTGLNPIGTIHADREAERGLVVADGHSGTPRAEAFRRLRTNLQYVAVDRKPRSIVVTSARPGDGKSSTACNLAISLAQAGRRVVLVEADLRRPSFGKYLNIEPGAGLTSVLTGAADVMEVLQPWGSDGLLVLASGPIPPNPAEILGSRGMTDVLRQLNSEFDYVIIDSPPLLAVADGAIVAAAADGVLLVAAARQTKRGELMAALGSLNAVDALLLGVVLNRLPAKDLESYSYSYASRTPSRAGRGVGTYAPRSKTQSGGHPVEQRIHGSDRGDREMSDSSGEVASSLLGGEYEELNTMRLAAVDRRRAHRQFSQEHLDSPSSEAPYHASPKLKEFDENHR